LKSFNLVKDSVNGHSKGFAFFEYAVADPSMTDRDCNGLNGMKLGEKTILVQRANIGAKHPPINPHTTSILVNPTAANFLNLSMPIAAACALLGIAINDPGAPTRIVQLMNMVSGDDILDPDECEDIMDDIREESSKFGTVLSLYSPRPPPKVETEQDGGHVPATSVSWGVGRVFVEYKRKEDALKAQQAFAGRKFNGRIILSGFWPEDRYEQKNFLPDEEEERSMAERFKKQVEQKQREEEARELDDNSEYYQD